MAPRKQMSTGSAYAIAYSAAWAAGMALVVADINPRLTGFGLGILAPGGGLAFYGHWPELAGVLAGATWLVWKREFPILGYAWFAIATISLTHGPHHDMGWPAARSVIPALALVTVGFALGSILRTVRHRPSSVSTL